jgi:hypothetical protein
MKRLFAFALVGVSVAIGAETCRKYLVRIPYYAHRVSKQRQIEIAKWNKAHPAWVDEWKRKHLYAEIDVLCDIPTSGEVPTGDITFAIPMMPEPLEPSPDLPSLSPEEPPQFPSTSADSSDSFTAYQLPYALIVTNGAYMPTTPTPEPSTILLMLSGGLAGLAGVLRGRKDR